MPVKYINYGNQQYDKLLFDAFFPPFSLAENLPGDRQITGLLMRSSRGITLH